MDQVVIISYFRKKKKKIFLYLETDEENYGFPLSQADVIIFMLNEKVDVNRE